MKKILSVALGAAAMAGLLASCSEDNFDSKYSDPSKTSTVSVNQVFTGVMNAGKDYMDPMYYRYYTQSTTSGVFSGIIANSNGRGRFRGAGEGYFNTRWKSFYNMLTQHRVLEDNYNNLEPDQQAANKVFFILSRTMVEAQLHEMLSLFGAVPYNEAGTLWKTGDYAGAKPAYESDVELYKMILKDLKEAGDYLAGGVPSAGANALVRADFSDAHGNIDTWQRYINSLRLRVALHLVNGDCASEAKAAIKEILENPTKYPVIETNAQNMTVPCDNSRDDYNFGKSFSQALHTGGNSYGEVSQAVLDALHVAADGSVTADTDPRIVAMVDPNPDGKYLGIDISKSSTDLDAISTEASNRYTDMGIEQGKNLYSKVDSVAIQGIKEYSGNENLKGVWLTAAEVELSKAEAYLMGYGVAADASKAKTAFVKGIELSGDFYWGTKKATTIAPLAALTVADVKEEAIAAIKEELGADFDKLSAEDLGKKIDEVGQELLKSRLNDSYNGKRKNVIPTTADFTAYAEKIWDAKQETVCTQLWLNHFVYNELEAWNITRRTGFPVVKFAEDAKQTDYALPPHRLPYPSDELNYNGDNCQAAIATYLGGDNTKNGYYKKLFWAKDNYYSIVAKQ